MSSQQQTCGVSDGETGSGGIDLYVWACGILGFWQGQIKHRKEVESISNRTFTQSDQKSRAAEINKSAITDHVAKENHVINWSGAKILEREGHRKTRQVKKWIWIRKEQRWRDVQLTDSLWPSYGHALNITWPQPQWSSPLVSETSQLI